MLQPCPALKRFDDLLSHHPLATIAAGSFQEPPTDAEALMSPDEIAVYPQVASWCMPEPSPCPRRGSSGACASAAHVPVGAGACAAAPSRPLVPTDRRPGTLSQPVPTAPPPPTALPCRQVAAAIDMDIADSAVCQALKVRVARGWRRARRPCIPPRARPATHAPPPTSCAPPRSRPAPLAGAVRAGLGRRAAPRLAAGGRHPAAAAPPHHGALARRGGCAALLICGWCSLVPS